MPHAPIPSPGLQPSSLDPSRVRGLDLVAETLDPVLVPLGLAPGQVGTDAQRGQVIFCRGEIGSPDGGCVDLVVEVEAATPGWQITNVRYWGYPSDRWHLDFDRGASLADQVADLAHIIRSTLQ